MKTLVVETHRKTYAEGFEEADAKARAYFGDIAYHLDYSEARSRGTGLASAGLLVTTWRFEALEELGG